MMIKYQEFIKVMLLLFFSIILAAIEQDVSFIFIIILLIVLRIAISSASCKNEKLEVSFNLLRR